MDAQDFQERYFESLDAVQALLELITKREEEVNSLYVRVESLEQELEKRQKVISALKGEKSETTHEHKRDRNKSISNDGTPPSVLLVDPIPRMRLILKEILISAGFEVMGEAEDLRGSMAFTKHNPPDLVIINAKLRNESGLDVLKKIREIKPDIAAILITEGPDPLLVISALEQGVADIIPKPINRLRLYESAKSLVAEE